MRIMSNNGEEYSIPKLVDDVPSSRLSSLQDLIVTFISNNPHVIFIEEESGLKFRDGVFLPSTLAEPIFQDLLKNPMNPSITAEKILSTFSDSSSCCLQKCHLDSIEVTPECVFNLCQSQSIQILELFNVVFSGPNKFNFIKAIKICGSDLLSFHMRDIHPNPGIHSFHYFRNLFDPLQKSIIIDGSGIWHYVLSEQVPMPLVSLESRGIVAEGDFCFNPFERINFNRTFSNFPAYEPHPNTVLHSVETDVVPRDGGDDMVVQCAKKRILDRAQLPFQDISLWLHNLHSFQYGITTLQHTLVSLSLYDCEFHDEDYVAIFELHNLQHLDLGCSTVGNIRQKPRPDVYTVWDVIFNIPALVSLDLSGTELGDSLYHDGKFKAITGERMLNKIVDRRLEFLGLNDCQGCEVADIYSLADEVSGYHNEHQIMTALERYKHRPRMLVSCYNHLYRLNRYKTITCPHRALRFVMDTLQRFPYDDDIPLPCTANLFFLFREHYTTYTRQQRNEMLMIIMRCLNSQAKNSLVVRNLILSLYHFEIPGDFIFQFGYITKTLLKILVMFQQNVDVNSHVINMCNILVCSMKHDLKSEVAKYDFVPTIVRIIEERLRLRQPDEVTQVAWSALWNVTDETPQNSKIFVELNGLQLIMSYFENFEEESEIHKNMMGLVGNIAEVQFLRPNLMSSGLMPIFYNLMIKENQNLEVAYNVAGSMSHLLSDGPEAWTCEALNRDMVRQNMYSVIESWNINASRSINYRSFKPILGLIYCDVPECVHWAVWALCNLSSIDAKYCNLLAAENGLEILASVETKLVSAKTKELARIIIGNVNSHLKKFESE